MMDVNAKYKRWGRLALLGLGAVIIVAGLIVAVTLSRDPKPSGDVIVDETQSEYVAGEEGESSNEDTQDGATENDVIADNNASSAVDESSESQDISSDVAVNSSEMPKTGVEDILPSFVLIAIAVTLLAYNFELRRAK